MPKAEMLRFPEGYKKATKTLGWATVQARLVCRPGRNWVATTRPDGRPHVVPLDAV